MKKNYKKILSSIIIMIFLLMATSCNENNHNNTNNNKNDDNNVTENNNSKICKMVDVNNNDIYLSDFFNKVVVVNFWQNSCKYCIDEFGLFENMYQKYADKVNFVMINIDRNAKEKALELTKNYSFNVVFDRYEESIMKFKAFRTPYTFFLNKKGEIIYSQLGMMLEIEIENYILQLLEKQNI